MRPGGKVLILAAAVATVCLVALVASADPVPVPEGAVDRKHFQLPKLFDFAFYKERFGKHYHSLVEEVSRRALFVARAFRAFVSGMNYKYRKSSYYLAVNHLSDLSPAELDARRNKQQVAAGRRGHLDGDGEAPPVQQSLEDEASPEAPAGEDLPEFIPGEGENYEEEIRKLLEAHAGEPGYAELLAEAGSKRRKREVENPIRPTRQFSFEQLMQPGVHEQVAEDAEVSAKITNDVEGNNPDYEQPELETQGLNDNHADVSGFVLQPRSDSRRMGDQLRDTLEGLRSSFGSRDPFLSQDPDRMYFDHRDSKCLTTVRDQGDCGSCYAFAATALMEWMYCKASGKLVPLSEQYMVDCGKGRWNDRMSGCDGATDYSVIKFIQNFGVERQKVYPYRERETQCPYPESTDLKAAGYIRLNLISYTQIPVSRWDEYIKYAPMYMSIATPADYSEYSGGVHDGRNCGEAGDHAQLLVGHGREDGLDYWLIRNSYGPKWGDKGYFKLSKGAPARCVDGQIAYALGTSNGKNLTVQLWKNARNKELRRHQAKH